MKNSEILKSFYTAMEKHDWPTKRGLLHDDFRFRGPLMQANSADEFIAAMKQMNGAMTFKDVEMLEQGDIVMSFFTCVMTQPATMEFRVAERVKMAGGKLQSSEIIYDARVFPPMS